MPFFHASSPPSHVFREAMGKPMPPLFDAALKWACFTPLLRLVNGPPNDNSGKHGFPQGNGDGIFAKQLGKQEMYPAKAQHNNGYW
ncbi:DNA-directed RNA polymerase, M/15 kDa subunit [Anopheles sinensis]|uniref:DNA-directed RNA polymerase, M/15 kDa subunit n=1 Tax=Anopheles sinensis TaxID=74873 RepID=A0A084VSQ1_ANOSI|nr:DNA-directed RNA polymerase, M/15 kDa subunit [Anopheles sinensis]